MQTYVHLYVRIECKSLNILQKNMRLQLFLLIVTWDLMFIGTCIIVIVEE